MKSGVGIILLMGVMFEAAVCMVTLGLLIKGISKITPFIEKKS